MTARRASWDLTENRLSKALEARRARGEEILDLVESNPTRVGLEVPDEEVRAALSGPEVLDYEPAPKGLRAAREAIARYYASRDAALDPEDIVLTASTSEAYGFLFKLLADPGDEVLVPRPSYPLFDYLASLDSVVPRAYRLEHDAGWRIDLGSVERAIGPRTRAIVVVHPNNPTGSFVRQVEIDALAALARDRGIVLVSDEVFADWALAPDSERAGVVALRSDVPSFSLSGLSKVALLPQVKLAWIVVGGPDAAREDALARLEVIADTYLSVSSSAQQGAARLLRIGEGVRRRLSRRIAANLAVLRSRIAGVPAVQLLAPEGGWYVILRLPRIQSDEDWALELLSADGVHVHPGSFYDFEDDGFVVLSLIPEPATFERGVDRLLTRVARPSSRAG